MNKNLLELDELAEKSWEHCHGCDGNDKYFWKKGFMTGYNKSLQPKISEEEIEKAARQMFYNNSDSGWHVQFARDCFKEGAKWAMEELKQKL